MKSPFQQFMDSATAEAIDIYGAATMAYGTAQGIRCDIGELHRNLQLHEGGKVYELAQTIMVRKGAAPKGFAGFEMGGKLVIAGKKWEIGSIAEDDVTWSLTVGAPNQK